MISIIIILKRNMERKLNYYLQILIALCYEISETKDVYKDFWKYRKIYLIHSAYPQYFKFYDETNKKVIGKMKDEAAGTTNYRICWFT